MPTLITPVPSHFNGSTLATLITSLQENNEGKMPREACFDISCLRFIEPAGVVFLSNLLLWLDAQGCEVSLQGVSRNTPALKFLDDSLFFEHHCGHKCHPYATPRPTTLPLQEIAHTASFGWLELRLTPWLAGKLGRNKASLYDLEASLKELFNNIKDHTTQEVGSIFVQQNPNLNRVVLALADFGPGIPRVVRKVLPDLQDADAIIKAVEEGFTTRSLDTNRGQGLNLLLQNVVARNGGSVTIYSGHSIVEFVSRQGQVTPVVVLQDGGFCPGTTIELVLRTDNIEFVADDRESLEW